MSRIPLIEPTARNTYRWMRALSSERNVMESEWYRDASPEEQADLRRRAKATSWLYAALALAVTSLIILGTFTSGWLGFLLPLLAGGVTMTTLYLGVWLGLTQSWKKSKRS